MALKLHNTLSRKREEFTQLDTTGNEVKIYSCGPTVYDYVHIGNLRAFMSSDILRRYLKYKGFKVNQVMNITDVDDKTIRDSIQKGISLSEHTKPFTKGFFNNLRTLNIETVEHYPKATEMIPEMVKLIKILMEKGYAYKADDGIYYKISKFENYGKLAGLDMEKIQAGASKRVMADEYDKETANDFVLWKFYNIDDGDVFWETEIGKGRPGWHIECSAMSMKLLGDQLDIHTGGIDLIFPHHQNEIAQSEAATGKKFVNFWLHNEYMLVNGEKMSKSLGNFYKLQDLLDKGYEPMTIRYLLMSSQYRQKLNFTFDGLNAAKKAIDKLGKFMIKLDSCYGNPENSETIPIFEKAIIKVKTNFISSMNDDLNMSGALGSIFEFIREINKLMNKVGKDEAKLFKKILIEFDVVLGLELSNIKEKKIDIPIEIVELAENRKVARENKNWEESDKLRAEILAKGYVIKDSKEGYLIEKI